LRNNRHYSPYSAVLSSRSGKIHPAPEWEFSVPCTWWMRASVPPNEAGPECRGNGRHQPTDASSMRDGTFVTLRSPP
jgi:hypothetical protein